MEGKSIDKGRHTGERGRPADFTLKIAGSESLYIPKILRFYSPMFLTQVKYGLELVRSLLAWMTLCKQADTDNVRGEVGQAWHR
jgi:hypothetical protein